MKILITTFLITASLSTYAFGGPDSASEALREYYKDAEKKVAASALQAQNKEQLEAARKALKDLEKQRIDLEKALSDIEESKADFSADAEKYKGKIEDRKSLLAQVQSRRDAKAAEMLEKNRARRLEDAKETLADEKADLEKVKAEIQTKRALLKQKEGECQQYKSGTSEFGDGVFGSPCNEMGTISRDLNTLESETIAEAQSELREAEAAVQRLSSEDITVTGVELSRRQKESLSDLDRSISENERKLRLLEGYQNDAETDHAAKVAEMARKKQALQDVVGNISNSAATINQLQDEESRHAGNAALQRMALAIKNTLNDADNKQFRAEFMFSNLDSLTGALKSDLISENQALAEIKAQVMTTIDKTPVGLYVNEKIAQAMKAGGGTGSNLCADIASCNMMGVAASDLIESAKGEIPEEEKQKRQISSEAEKE